MNMFIKYCVVTILLSTCHCKVGLGNHPAAWHSNSTDCLLKASISRPKIFTLPFSAIRQKHIHALEFYTFCFYICACMYFWLILCIYEVLIPTKLSGSLKRSLLKIHVAAHAASVRPKMNITSPVGLFTFSKARFDSSWVIDRVSQSLNCLTTTSPLFPFISFPAS